MICEPVNRFVNFPEFSFEKIHIQSVEYYDENVV